MVTESMTKTRAGPLVHWLAIGPHLVGYATSFPLAEMHRLEHTSLSLLCLDRIRGMPPYSGPLLWRLVITDMDK